MFVGVCGYLGIASLGVVVINEGQFVFWSSFEAHAKGIGGSVITIKQICVQVWL